MSIKYHVSLILASVCLAGAAQTLTIIHTNDAHSQIDPKENNLGGVARRKVLIDSIRNAHPGALLVDAGDMVQGTVYFNLYNGKAEHDVINALGYDIQVPGNHEFDNGMDGIVNYYTGVNSTVVSTNYDVKNTPLNDIFRPYIIKEIDGKKVAFIGISVDLNGLSNPKNFEGIKFLDPLKAANSTAWHLKHNEGVDRVIAITHIGYIPENGGLTDPELAAASENIDVIIGGHSHNLIDGKDANLKPYVTNQVGDSVLITQTGKSAQWIGEVALDLDSGRATEKLHRVDKRLDKRVDPNLVKLLAGYKHGVDSLLSLPVTQLSAGFESDSPGLLNLITDVMKSVGEEIYHDKVDLAVSNKGGARSGWAKGTLTKGQIMNSFPFDNRVQVIKIKGKDIRELFDIMASRGGEGVSKNVQITYDPATGKCTEITIDGKPLDDDATYSLATISYLANGGDFFTPLTRGEKVASTDVIFFEDVYRILSAKKKIVADTTPRMRPRQ